MSRVDYIVELPLAFLSHTSYYSMSLISCGLVLRRVKDFLPKIKEAEEALQKELEVKSPSELDIENVEDAGPYVEMVGLKLVLWLRTRLSFPSTEK